MIRMISALLGILSWGCAAFFSIRYPQADSLLPGDFSAAWSWGWIIVVLGVGLWASWMAWLPKAGRREGRMGSGFRILLSLVAQIALAVFAASTLHRDFISLVFQAVAIHYALFIDSAPSYSSRTWVAFSGRLFALTFLVIFFFFAWIAMMGFAIVSRSEPRWIPSIGYNVLNLCLCALLVVANLNLRAGPRRIIAVQAGGLFVDAIDILPLVSPASRPLALCLVQGVGAGALTCAEAAGLLGLGACGGECGEGKACAAHRAVEGRIAELRALFSALRIGSLPEAPRGGAGEGEAWVFVPDSSVRVEGRGGCLLYQGASASLL